MKATRTARMLTRYNRWANELIFAAVAAPLQPRPPHEHHRNQDQDAGERQGAREPQ